MAVSERHAAELSGFSVRRLRAWDARGLVGPSIKRQLSERNTVRLYTFDDLVELLVASALVDAGRPPRQIRRVVEHLRDRDYKAPLRELRFAVSGDRIYFQHPDGLWEEDQAPDQVVLCRVLDLEAIKARIRRSVRPSRQHEAGHVERRRGVLGSKAVFAGTRVPVAAVEAFAGPTTTRRVRPGDDRATRAAVAAERAFQRALGGGCLTPIGALATVSGATVELAGMLADPVRRKGRALIGGYTRRRWSLADDVDRVEQVRRVASLTGGPRTTSPQLHVRSVQCHPSTTSTRPSMPMWRVQV